MLTTNQRPSASFHFHQTDIPLKSLSEHSEYLGKWHVQHFGYGTVSFYFSDKKGIVLDIE
jgi:hypothetical protein